MPRRRAILVALLSGLAFWLWGFIARHVQHDLAPTPSELAPRNVWRDVKDHARLRFHTGEAARRYNVLQKLSYGGVIFGLLPLMVLTGLTMSPGADASPKAVVGRPIRRPGTAFR